VDAGFAAAERRRTADSGADSHALSSAAQASQSFGRLRSETGSREAKARIQIRSHLDQHAVLAQRPGRWSDGLSHRIDDEVRADVGRATMSRRPGFTLCCPGSWFAARPGRRASRRLRTRARAVARCHAAPDRRHRAGCGLGCHQASWLTRPSAPDLHNGRPRPAAARMGTGLVRGRRSSMNPGSVSRGSRRPRRGARRGLP